ncbi:hypothetical protein [Clostridium sp. UBA2485]|uniref:hypothetical protein n=1 Tax=Clostridium sp. UBA2485 TaxID=1946352 RepID=UPI0025BA62A0|nr:hypothetical protein [Clostridium sp. UBA2485]
MHFAVGLFCVFSKNIFKKSVNIFGVSKSTIQGWVNKAKPVIVNEDKTLTAEDYMQMQKEMARLNEENEILKKAMAIFAKK